MSIAATTAYAEVRSGADRRLAGTNADEGPLKKELSRITAFVPTEAVATYVGVLGILTPNSEGWRWGLLGIIGGLTTFLCWYFWKTATRDLPTRALVWSVVFALIGLVAWASALPASPFFSIDGYTTAIGGVVVLIAAPVIPRLAVLDG